MLRAEEWQTVRDAVLANQEQRDRFEVERASVHQGGASFHLYRVERDRENRPIQVFARVWAATGQTFVHVTAHRPGSAQHEALLIASMHGELARLRDLRIRFQGKGLGTICLKVAEEIFHTHGVQAVTGWLSDVDYDSRPRQVYFYEKNGYDVVLTGKTGTVHKVLKALATV